MTKEEFLNKLKVNGRLVPKRCTVSWISQDESLWNFFKTFEYPKEFSDSDFSKIKFLTNNYSRCSICQRVIPKKHNYCFDHRNSSKLNKAAHNRVFDNEEFQAEVLALRNSGITVKQVAEHLGRDYQTVKNALVSIDQFSKKPPQCKISDTEFLSAYTLSKLKYQLAEELHTSAKTIEQIAKRLNLNLNTRYSYIDRSKTDIETILELNQTLTVKDIAAKLNASPGYIHTILRSHGASGKQHFYSSVETKIADFLNSIGVEFQRNVQGLSGKKTHVDFFISDYNLAIEVNGVYWHSELNGGKSRQYHMQKTLEAWDKGIDLIHLWDFEIIDKWNYVESLLRSKLGMNNRVFARSTHLEFIDRETASNFFRINHRQETVGGIKESTALIDSDGNILSIMSFGVPRFNSNYDLELLRFSTVPGITVVGGASKLISKFKNQSIISYSDNRFGSGDVYKSIGFTLNSRGKPTYFYFLKGDCSTLFSRQKFQKHKLKNILEHFDPSLSEWENMQLNGYDRVWDCGQSVWVLER